MDSIINLDPLNKDMMDSIVYYSDGRIDIAESYGTRIIRNQLRQNLQNHLGLNGKILNDGSIISDTETEIVKGRRDAFKEERYFIEELEQMGELTPERIDTYSVSDGNGPPEDIELFYPITPQTALLVTKKQQYKNEKMLKITSDDVQAFNTLEWNASNEMVFAKESEYLERVHTL